MNCFHCSWRRPVSELSNIKILKMKLYRATIDDFASIIAFYDDVTDRTPDIELYARWQKGKHPTHDGIRALQILRFWVSWPTASLCWEYRLDRFLFFWILQPERMRWCLLLLKVSSIDNSLYNDLTFSIKAWKGIEKELKGHYPRFVSIFVLKSLQ